MSASAPVGRLRVEFDADPQDFAGDVFGGREHEVTVIPAEADVDELETPPIVDTE